MYIQLTFSFLLILPSSVSLPWLLNLSKYLYYICLFGRRAWTTAYTRRSEDNFWESVLSSLHMGPWDGAHIIRFGSKPLYAAWTIPLAPKYHQYVNWTLSSPLTTILFFCSLHSPHKSSTLRVLFPPLRVLFPPRGGDSLSPPIIWLPAHFLP